MKHPLTSKERRGLAAVAAAALLCIGIGVVVRNCGVRAGVSHEVVVIDNDSTANLQKQYSDTKKEDKMPSNGKRARRSKRQKAEKTYPSRSPLDEPI